MEGFTPPVEAKRRSRPSGSKMPQLGARRLKLSYWGLPCSSGRWYWGGIPRPIPLGPGHVELAKI